MIESLIGRPGDKLRKLLGVISVMGAVTLTTLLATMALASAPALAAFPEAPATEAPSPLAGTTATLKGELNPGSSTEKVVYHFAYSTGAECTESGLTAPAEPFPEAAGNHKKVSAAVTELEGSTEYTVCLIAANPAEPGEATQGTLKKFKTLASKAVVIAESATEVGAFTAKLQAEVNPENQSTTSCAFEYGKTVSEHTTACEQATLSGSNPEIASLSVAGLQSATKYHYRVVIKNATGETKGPEEEFETIAPPSELETGDPEAVTTTSATIGGKLNAGGEAMYYIEYGTAPCLSTTCGEKSTETPVGGRTQEAVTPIEIRNLKPNTTYHYWLVANNGAALEPVHGEAKVFTTENFAPSRIEVGSVEDVTTTGAELTGKFNPGGEARYYVEYGTAQCSSTTCGQRSTESVLVGETQKSIAPIVLSGLHPNTVYYYWLVATNSGSAEPVHGEAAAFKTAETPAEKAAAEAALSKSAAEAQAQAAAKSKLEAEARSREEAAAAVAAAQQKQYNEIAAITATDERQAAEAKRVEELIAATSAKITKTKVGAGSVRVTFDVTQAGTVTITGTGLKKKVAKVAAGTHTMTIALTSTGKKDRKHHKKATITATLETSLTSVSASTTIKL